MPLSDLITHDLVSCSPDTTIAKVARLMKDRDVGSVLVLENEKPVGIVTDRDIVLRCIAEKTSLDAEVRDIMTKSVDCASLDNGLHDVIALMRSRQVRRIPVIDKDGKAVGLISFGDLVGLLARELSELSYDTAVKAAA